MPEPVHAEMVAEPPAAPAADHFESSAASLPVAAEIEPIEVPEPAMPEPVPQEVESQVEPATPVKARRFNWPDISSWLARLRGRMARRKAEPGEVSTLDEAEASDLADEAAAVQGAGLANARDYNPLPSEDVPPMTSDEIFAEIGRRLRERREMLSLTYEEIERHTHVRSVFLSALERGALQDLPSPVQTRGILVNYAGFLDLDVDTIMLRYADGLQTRYREKGSQKPKRSKALLTVNTKLPPLRTFIASDLVFGGGLAIMLLLFAIWGISRVMAVRSETAVQPTPPSISAMLAGTLLPTVDQQVTVIPAQDTPLPAASLQAAATLVLATLDPNVKVEVDLSTSERTYMRVTVDGKVQFEGRTDVSSSYTYQAQEQVEVLVGNAAAVRVTYNGHDLGLMGNFGQVIDRLYTIEGVATPTSTPRPTNTPTPFETGTPTETPTLTPTRTRTPTPGG